MRYRKRHARVNTGLYCLCTRYCKCHMPGWIQGYYTARLCDTASATPRWIQGYFARSHGRKMRSSTEGRHARFRTLIQKTYGNAALVQSGAGDEDAVTWSFLRCWCSPWLEEFGLSWPPPCTCEKHPRCRVGLDFLFVFCCWWFVFQWLLLLFSVAG